MFGDTFELEYVIDLLKGYADAAKLDLTPAELQTLHDNSVLWHLEQKLRKALLKSGIDAWRLADANEVTQLSFCIRLLRLNNLQEAQIRAFQTLLAAPDPGDWDPDRLTRFELELKTIHAIQGDIARTEAERHHAFRGGRRRGAISEEQKILRDLITKHPTLSGAKRFWRDVLVKDSRITVVSEDVVMFPSGKTLAITSFAATFSKARAALEIRPAVSKSRKKN